MNTKSVDSGLVWRAGLPALGRAAALNQALRWFRKNAGVFTGAASQPNAGKPARHKGPLATGVVQAGVFFTRNALALASTPRYITSAISSGTIK